jgi:hypothetical protein
MTFVSKTFVAALLAVFSFLAMPLVAQTQTTAPRTHVSIETDPSTFTFNGYAFHIRIQPKNSKHFVIGAGTYALDFPAFMVDMNSKNKDKGWKVRVSSAYSLFGEYYFGEAGTKWFAGLQVGVQQYKNSNPGKEVRDMKYANLLLMPSIGYTWQPFKFPLYLKPWFGLGYTSKVSGSNVSNGVAYDISPVVPFVTLHVGYRL